jgi:YVTN family beta-propeller protein
MKILAAAIALLLACSAQAGRLYVTNERDGTLQVIDTATDRVIATARIADRPRGVALSPDGKRVYLAVSWWRNGKQPRTNKERILALDAQTLKAVREYAAGTDPECVAVSPDGKRLYLSNEDGEMLVLAAGPKYAHLATNSMGELLMATPALSERVMYVRSSVSVFAVGRKP